MSGERGELPPFFLHVVHQKSMQRGTKRNYERESPAWCGDPAGLQQNKDELKLINLQPSLAGWGWGAPAPPPQS